MYINSLPAALRAAQICRYLVYSEADFEVFHVAPMGVKFGMEEGTVLQVENNYDVINNSACRSR